MNLMPLEEIANLVQREVQRQMTMVPKARHLLVTSYDPKTHAAKGTFEPEHIPSGWIPIRSHGASHNGISEQIGPVPGGGSGGATAGDLALVLHAEGDPESAIILGFLHNLVDTPPGAQSGQHIVSHNPTGLMRIIDKLGHAISATAVGQVINHIATAIMHVATTGDITHTAQQGNIGHVAQQNITHSAQNGSITDKAQMSITHTAQTISLDGSQTVNIAGQVLNIG